MAVYDYDVFLNFLTGDTHDFTSLLFDALDQAGIRTFIGYPLWHTTENSRIVIIVFSENYASSPRCLRELQEIMKCHETQAQLVFPIFYNISLSDVCHQRGRYGEAMERHEQSIVWSDLVLPWRQALTKAANLHHFDMADFLSKSNLIRHIVACVREAAVAYNYDVFLSFKATDNHGFTTNLKQALEQARICTFAEGNEEQPSLAQIQKSRIAIIVFSKDYASSTRRLDELMKIMECQRNQTQLVMPIFYEVRLADVRSQTGSYGEAMELHEQNLGNGDLVSQWRFELKKAVDSYMDDIDGFIKLPYYSNDDELIARIVYNVILRIPGLYACHSEKLQDLEGIMSIYNKDK